MIWDEYKPVRIKANKFPFMQVTIDKTIKTFVKDKVHRASVKGPKFLGQEQVGTQMVQVGTHQEQVGTERYQTGTRSVRLRDVLDVTQTYISAWTFRNKSSRTISFKDGGGASFTLQPGQSASSTYNVNLDQTAYTEPIYGTRPVYKSVPDYEEQPVMNNTFGLVMGVRRRSK